MSGAERKKFACRRTPMYLKKLKHVSTCHTKQLKDNSDLPGS
jgi:hypothetical protein